MVLRRGARLGWTALLATCALAALVARAEANSFTLVERSFTATWPELRIEVAGNSVTCAVTLEGSFSEGTYAKRTEATVATITEASFASCSNPVTVLTETLPWSVEYASFGGSLPEISSVALHVVGASIAATLVGVTCLARSTSGNPLVVTAARNVIGEVTRLDLDEAAGIPLEGGFFCRLAGSAHAAGGASVLVPGEPTRGLVLTLEAVGTSLEGATAEESEEAGTYPIAGLVIGSGRTESSRGIRNRGSWYENRITRIRLIGGDNTRFDIPNEEVGACRGESAPGREDGTHLAVGGGSCNIRVRLTGARPASSTVEITYAWGLVWNSFATESFTVEAP